MTNVAFLYTVYDIRYMCCAQRPTTRRQRRCFAFSQRLTHSFTQQEPCLHDEVCVSFVSLANHCLLRKNAVVWPRSPTSTKRLILACVRFHAANLAAVWAPCCVTVQLRFLCVIVLSITYILDLVGQITSAAKGTLVDVCVYSLVTCARRTALFHVCALNLVFVRVWQCQPLRLSFVKNTSLVWTLMTFAWFDATIACRYFPAFSQSVPIAQNANAMTKPHAWLTVLQMHSFVPWVVAWLLRFIMKSSCGKEWQHPNGNAWTVSKPVLTFMTKYCMLWWEMMWWKISLLHGTTVPSKSYEWYRRLLRPWITCSYCTCRHWYNWDIKTYFVFYFFTMLTRTCSA